MLEEVTVALPHVLQEICRKSVRLPSGKEGTWKNQGKSTVLENSPMFITWELSNISKVHFGRDCAEKMHNLLLGISSRLGRLSVTEHSLLFKRFG